MSDHAQGNPYRVYKVTWGILLVITAGMLLAEKVNMPRWFLLAFLLRFVAVKAVLLGGSFRHLRYGRMNSRVVVAAGLVVTSLILSFCITPESAPARQHSTRPAAPAAAAAPIDVPPAH